MSVYACICSAVTVDEIQAAIASGARSIDMISACTSAGTSCGICHDHLEDILNLRCGIGIRDDLSLLRNGYRAQLEAAS